MEYLCLIVNILWRVLILNQAGPFLQNFKLMQHNILTKLPVFTVKEFGGGKICSLTRPIGYGTLMYSG